MNSIDLFSLNPEDFRDRDVSIEEILSWLDACDAYWMHSGNVSDPHAELT